MSRLNFIAQSAPPRSHTPFSSTTAVILNICWHTISSNLTDNTAYVGHNLEGGRLPTQTDRPLHQKRLRLSLLVLVSPVFILHPFNDCGVARSLPTIGMALTGVLIRHLSQLILFKSTYCGNVSNVFSSVTVHVLIIEK